LCINHASENLGLPHNVTKGSDSFMAINLFVAYYGERSLNTQRPKSVSNFATVRNSTNACNYVLSLSWYYRTTKRNYASGKDGQFRTVMYFVTALE